MTKFAAILVHFLYFLRCQTISRRAARRMIVLHSKLNIESELKWQICLVMCQHIFAGRQ